MADKGVLLIDWDNLAGAVRGRGMTVDRKLVDALWDFARDRMDGSPSAHVAATQFDPSISKAMQEHLMDQEVVRAAKEQADILLTVLAMDYLHSGAQKFILVTGDQDFIPLIDRLHRDRAEVTVVYGDSHKLSPELTKTLATVGVSSLDIEQIAKLEERRIDSSGRAFAAMLELTRRGVILGGKGRDDRLEFLVDCGLASAGEENDYWALVDQFCRKETRFGAAVMGPDKTWTPVNAMRTYLDVTDARMDEVTALDAVLRTLSSRPTGVSVGALLTGPLADDDGKKIDAALDSLVALGLVRRQGDGTASIVGTPIALGYVEPLWRVHVAVLAETHRLGASSLPYHRLESLLVKGGVGQGADTRAAGRVKDTIRHAVAAGVIDSVAVAGKRHARAVDSKLTDSIERAYRILYSEYRGRIGEELAEDIVLLRMESLDESNKKPTFGYLPRDRHRVLRVLSQSGLIRKRGGSLSFVKSAWGEGLTGSAS